MLLRPLLCTVSHESGRQHQYLQLLLFACGALVASAGRHTHDALPGGPAAAAGVAAAAAAEVGAAVVLVVPAAATAGAAAVHLVLVGTVAAQGVVRTEAAAAPVTGRAVAAAVGAAVGAV